MHEIADLIWMKKKKRLQMKFVSILGQISWKVLIQNEKRIFVCNHHSNGRKYASMQKDADLLCCVKISTGPVRALVELPCDSSHFKFVFLFIFRHRFFTFPLRCVENHLTRTRKKELPRRFFLSSRFSFVCNFRLVPVWPARIRSLCKRC